MDTSAALELLFPSFLHFIGIASSVIVSLGAIAASLQLPRPLKGRKSILLIGLAVVCIGALLGLALWTEGLRFGDTKATRFGVLCQSAGLQIHRRLGGAQGVVVIAPDGARFIHYGDMGPPSPAALLASANIQFVEQQAGAAGVSHYTRFSRPVKMESVRESVADVVVTMKTIVTDGEIKAGIYGEEMLIAERASGQALATFRYFWTVPRPVESCPKPKQGINTSQIVSYVVGLKDPTLEERWRGAFIP